MTLNQLQSNFNVRRDLRQGIFEIGSGIAHGIALHCVWCKAPDAARSQLLLTLV